MSIKKIIAVAAALGAVWVPAARAQTSTNTAGNTNVTLTSGTTTQDLFRVTFRAICRAVNTNGTNLLVTNITEKDIVAQAVNASNTSATNAGTGGTGTGTASTNDFLLVYNTSVDSLQVVNRTNGNPLTDVINFGAGSSVTQGRTRQRFAFMFLPGVTNAFGSAVITETAPAASTSTTNNRATILGRIQFALTNNETLGVTNLTSTNTSTSTGGTTLTSGTSTNFFTTGAFDDPTAKICSGFFITSGRIPPKTNTTSSATSGTGTSTNTASATATRTSTTTRVSSTSTMVSSGSSSGMSGGGTD